MLRVHNQREEHTRADDSFHDDAFDSVSSVVTSATDNASVRVAIRPTPMAGILLHGGAISQASS